MNCIAIILSGGTGSRFLENQKINIKKPKQFIEISNKSVLEHSIKAFQDSNFIDAVVVVGNSDFETETTLIANKFSKVIQIVQGGARRQDSVFNALTWINNNKKTKFVLVHDSARALVSSTVIQNVYKKLEKGASCVIPGVPLIDTIKELDIDYLVKSTPDRSKYMRVQTPQGAKFSELLEAYSVMPKDVNATDDASIMEYAKKDVFVVEGDERNIKITYPIDAKIAEIMLEDLIMEGEVF